MSNVIQFPGSPEYVEHEPEQEQPTVAPVIRIQLVEPPRPQGNFLVSFLFGFACMSVILAVVL